MTIRTARTATQAFQIPLRTFHFPIRTLHFPVRTLHAAVQAVRTAVQAVHAAVRAVRIAVARAHGAGGAVRSGIRTAVDGRGGDRPRPYPSPGGTSMTRAEYEERRRALEA